MGILRKKDFSGKELIRLFILISMISIATIDDAMGESTSAIGLSSSEAITLLGFPVEKIERESKRESQWSFLDGRIVLLREGVVVREEWRKRVQQSTKEQVGISTESSHSEFIFSGNELLSAMKQIEEETKTAPASNPSVTRSRSPKRQPR